MKILIATNNRHKLSEIGDIVSSLIPDAEILSLKDVGFSKDIIEDADSFEGNAMIKVNALTDYGMITIADDSGLEVDYLDGAPGVYSARFAGEICDDKKNNEKLLKCLENVPDERRNARFVSCIALRFPDGRSFTVRGEKEGTILRDYRGSGGFGYDPLFYCPDLRKTFSELTPDEKNKYSHRALALVKFAEIFRQMI